ncbi:hypothetical protein BS47DRAFT_1044372 [Hydnum rufescens UP504]|uniref:Uncharacterized protein n=1 Tax=Hydnum rufescens UP504 TaxID=1448309 RepID=A0A9P6AW08_9AGAM|nr:hypothetical protein BS47DRAFT_1044372 [Hydnum rufescens UP504]
MDHMQQHTGQHLLSAIMDTYEGLETLGWSMGASISLTDDDVAPNMNLVELGRKPTDEEIDEIQRRCNEVIPRNVRITVDTPEDAKIDSLPSDYDVKKEVARVIKIDGIDEKTRRTSPSCYYITRSPSGYQQLSTGPKRSLGHRGPGNCTNTGNMKVETSMAPDLELHRPETSRPKSVGVLHFIRRG